MPSQKSAPFRRKAIALALIAAYGGCHEAHLAHRIVEEIQRPLAVEPAIRFRDFAALPHGGEPEAPSWPLRTPSVLTQTSTVSATTSFAVRTSFL